MTGLIIGLILAVVVLCLVISVLAYEIVRGNDRLEADHAMCVAHTADVSSDRILAMFARELARRWGSVEEKSNLIQLGREQYHIGGPSMPEIWLNQQADLIDPKNRPEEEDE